MSRVLFFTSWYNEKHEARRAELETCVRNCLESPDLDMVYLLCEGGARFPVEHPKLVQHPVEERPTYNRFFEFANQVSHSGDVCLISNTDIFPAPATRQFFDFLKQDQCWALSRWDVQQNGDIIHHKRRDSMDVWGFRAPIRTNIKGDFFMGVAGCDDSINCWIKEAGYDISNPSCDVQFCHLHLTGVHNYDPGKPIPAPYLLIEPSNVNTVQSEKYHIGWTPSVERPLTPHTRS